MSDRLSLGPLPSTKTVRVTVSLNTALSAALEHYAALHSQTWREPVDGPSLIPHIIEQFLRRDRRFKQWQRQTARPRHHDGPDES